MRHPLRSSVFAVAALAALSGRAAAEPPTVVASITPVYSLVAAVMDGVGQPTGLLPPGASPHSYALKPSQARMLSQADLVFWVGPGLEGFLNQALDGLTNTAHVMALHDAAGVVRLKARAGGVWNDADKDGHDHDHDHEGESFDAHVWLDPRNARAWTTAIAERLAATDPANADAYRRNAAATLTRLASLEKTLAERLEPVKEISYLVFHDAYQYFEHRFGLTPAGAVSVSPEHVPGARRVAELRALVRDRNAVCVFSEPQFQPRLVQVVVEGTEAKADILDPLGSAHAPGPDHYFLMMQDLAEALVRCLKRP
ncbi:MAG: zinc ABC transporter substrate-binding protein [Rhodospirillaceae bacterium]